MLNATINGTTWSLTVTLPNTGVNSIWLTAYPTDTDCDPAKYDLTLNYQPGTGNVCPNPVLVTLTSHTNNQTVTTQTVTLT